MMENEWVRLLNLSVQSLSNLIQRIQVYTGKKCRPEQKKFLFTIRCSAKINLWFGFSVLHVHQEYRSQSQPSQLHSFWIINPQRAQYHRGLLPKPMFLNQPRYHPHDLSDL